MKFKSVKKTSDMVLEGVSFQMEMLDSQLHSVTLTDKQGNVVKFSKHNYSDFGAFVPTIEKEKKFELVYELELAGAHRELFDDEYTTKNRLSDLENVYGSQLKNHNMAQTEIELPF